MKLNGIKENWDWASFGIGTVAGIVIDEFAGFLWRHTFGKKSKDEVAEEESSGSIAGVEERALIARELGILGGKLPVSLQQTMQMQFGVVDAFTYTDASGEEAAKIGQEILATVAGYNRAKGYSDLGTEVDDLDHFLNEREDNLIEIIEKSSGTEEVCASTVSAVRWLIGALRQPESKVAACSN